MRLLQADAAWVIQEGAPAVELRTYQTAALDSLFAYWAEGGDDAILELATGTGKSLVMAEICRRLVTEYHDFKIINSAHVHELVAQNHGELLNLWIAAPAGIYSAGLNKREARSQITFCGIQSVYNKASLFGLVDLLIVDEAHLISPKSGTMYDRLIAELRSANPEMRVLKLTATPFRLSSGAIPGTIVYTYGIADGVRDGWLARLTSKGMETRFDLTGVQKKGGEYVESQLQAAVDKDDITRRAVAEAISYGQDGRKSWLAFCSGVEHAYHVRDEIKRRGFRSETITGKTPSSERASIIADFKAGRIRCLTNNSVLTTGFNAPGVDMIMALRPTASPGLYVQMAGRGTRIASGKDNCLVLDYARLVETHGPVDDIRPPKSKGGGIAPIKECPTCHSLIPAASRECPECGHGFEPLGVPHEPKITPRASGLSIMSEAPATWLTVTGRTFALHHKPDTPTSVLTKFKCGNFAHKRWYAPARASKGHFYADRFWFEHGGDAPAPYTAEEWLERQYELRPTEQISVKPDGKYFRVEASKAADALVLAL